MIVLVSCKESKSVKQKSKNETRAHWSYEGETSPDYWAEIEKNSSCDGKRQSPINIIVDDTLRHTSETGSLEFMYADLIKLKKVINNGHSIEFDFEPGDSLSYNKEVYHLKQIHFHEPSEHTINGVRYPIEIHFVHASDYGNYLVLGTLGREGREEETFQFFDRYVHLEPGSSMVTNQKVDLEKISPDTNNYYAYKGSLTTPPCSENVTWVIFKNRLVLSSKTIGLIRENMPANNYRTTQPLNGRVVYSH